jgi:hypothetical protein
LNNERIAALNATEGWTWDDDRFFTQFENWKQQFKMKGRKPSESSTHVDEKRAGKWQGKMRHAYKGNKLNNERIAALNATEGWTWDDDRFFTQFESWKTHFHNFGVMPSTTSTDLDEKRAGQWQSNMRKAYKENKLNDERITTLNATEGWTWDDDRFYTQLANWKAQFRKNGVKPSQISLHQEEKRAGQWQNQMRQAYKRNKLNDERIATLNTTEGWKWKDDRFCHN